MQRETEDKESRKKAKGLPDMGLSTGILVRRQDPLSLTDDSPGILLLAPPTHSPCDPKCFPHCLVPCLCAPHCSLHPHRELLLIEKWVEDFKSLCGHSKNKDTSPYSLPEAKLKTHDLRHMVRISVHSWGQGLGLFFFFLIYNEYKSILIIDLRSQKSVS